MGRDYQLCCKDCNDKIDFSNSTHELMKQSEELDETFFFDEAFNNCTEIDDESIPVDVQELRAWLDKHEGHAIYFGW